MTKPPWDKLYSCTRWRKLRQRHLDKHPLCVMCSKLGIVQEAKIVDHIKAHKGDMVLFWDSNNLQSLCKPHHDSTKQSEEKGGKPRIAIGPDGWPIE